MVFVYRDREYVVDIVRKNNKNTYIRVKNGRLCITTNYFTSDRSILMLLKENEKSISKMIDRDSKRSQNEDIFYLWGIEYKVLFHDLDSVIIDNHCLEIYVKNLDILEKYLKKEIYLFYYERLMYFFRCFEENIPMPSLKIRKMKSRWGVCNTKTFVITLNYELVHYSKDCLDYVVVHELSHLLVPNHSKKFWSIVSKYCPNYKEIRKKLRCIC